MSARRFPKKYWRKDGQEFIQNGQSILAISHRSTVESVAHPGRITKIFEVLKEVRRNPDNAASPGVAIALSFPMADYMAPKYEWRHDEPFQVRLVAEVTGDPAKNIELDKARKRWQKTYKE